MAAKYIHDRSLDQFMGGVVWVDLKKMWKNQGNSQGVNAGGEQSNCTLFNCLRSVLDGLYKLTRLSQMGSLQQLTRGDDYCSRGSLQWFTSREDLCVSSRNLRSSQSGCDHYTNNAGISMARYFNLLPRKLLIVLRGLDYITVRNQIQDTEATVGELLACPAAPTLLITHSKDLHDWPIEMTRHELPELSKKDAASLFCSKANELFSPSDLLMPLIPPMRWQVLSVKDNWQYNTDYFNTKEEAEKEVAEQKRNLGEPAGCRRLWSEVKDLAPGGKSHEFPIVPELEDVYWDSEDEKKIQDEKKKQQMPKEYNDFLDWLTFNPSRINQVAKFATVNNLTNCWKIISSFAYCERAEILRMICSIGLADVAVAQNLNVKKLFEMTYLVNLDRRIKWDVLKRLLSIRFQEKVNVNQWGIPLSLTGFDWRCIETKPLKMCTSNKNLSLSEMGFCVFMRWFIDFETNIRRTLNSLASLQQVQHALPRQIMILYGYEIFLTTSWSSMAQRRWKRSMLCDSSQRVPVSTIENALPLCLWKLLPKSKRHFQKEEIKWIAGYTTENFITRKELKTVSQEGWLCFLTRALVPWSKMIKQEIIMWNRGVFIGFCQEWQCRNWLEGEENGTFIVRFSLSRSNAVAITYLHNGELLSSLVKFAEEEINPWSYDVSPREPPVKMKNLTGVLENFQLNIGLNPYSKAKYPLNKLVEEKSEHYVLIPRDKELEEGFYQEQPEGLRRPREMAQILEGEEGVPGQNR